MSTTVDERVVEMRFDNKHFESNVATSMSTLDKLKQKLNLSGASKGLEDINAASRKVDMSGLGRSVESVSAKFSALQVMGVTALANITNQAVNAGKRMVSALTIDPITSGFKEYETQINSVQTILANTSSKGTTITDVTAALDELNKYADMTIYNFTEMTRNIGTFTAAGVDLETSVNAIQGIANLAAVSGSTSQQASTAMYQLSQALAAGTVKLMDWNSVVNAGMGGEVFQNALKETSRLLGTGADEAIKATGSFRESLREEWLTAEVLTETLKKFTSSGAVEYIAEYTGESQEAVNTILKETDAWGNDADAIDKAAEALAKKSGKNKDEIKSALEMAKNAQDAATKVKTFSQLWDVMKEAAQSGWAKTWQIIIGDFEEAKALLTPLSDFVTNIINKMSDWRNNLLDSALGRGIGDLSDKINSLLEPAKGAAEAVTKTVESVEDLGDIVDRVIIGEFGNGVDRYNALTEAGQNYYRIQNKVNETLGDGYRYSDELIVEQDKLLGKQGEVTEKTEEQAKETVKLTDAQKNQIKKFAAMTEEQAKANNLTDKQIKSLKELKEQANQLGVPFDEFIDNLDEINGRWLLFNSFKNIGKSLISVFNSIKEAWTGVFPPKSLEERAEGIFNLITALSRFTYNIRTKLVDSSDEITRTFKGIFAILDIVTTILGGGFKIALKVISQILSYFSLDILDVTASIGDALVAFNEWFDSIFDISGVLDVVVPSIENVVNVVRDWYAAFKETPAVQEFITAIEAIQSAFDKLTSSEININEFASSLGENLGRALKSLPDIAVQIGKDFIAGFQNGIEFSISDVIGNIIEFCTNFISSFAEALGVQSPSWKAYDTATDFFQGFINGIKDMLEPVIKVLKTIGEKVIEVFKSLWEYITNENGDIEWGKLFAGGSIVAMLWFLKQLATAFSGIAEALGGFGDLLENAGRVMKSFSKVLNGVAFDLKAKAILKIAIAIGIVAAAFAIVALITKDIDKGTLWNTVGIIAALAVIVVGLAWAMSMLSTASIELDGKSKSLKASGIQKSLLQIGLTILALAAAVKIIGEMDSEAAEQGFIGLAGVAAGLVVFLAAMGGISLYAKDVDAIGSMMLKLSIAMGIMAFVMNTIGKIDPYNIAIGLAVMEAFVLLIMQLGVANRIAGTADGFGGNVLKISIAMGIMATVLKIIATMDPGDVLTGIVALEAFVLLIAQMALINRLAGSGSSKFGGAIMAMATSILILTGVIWLLSKMNQDDIQNGIVAMQMFVLVVGELLLVSKIAGKDGSKVASTILAMSAAIAILAGVAIILSFVPLGGLAKGITAVGLLSLMMSLMVKQLKGAQNAKGAIMMMAITIGVMAAAVAALSFIPVEDLAAATLAMVALMATFALMVKQLKGVKGVEIGPLITLTGVVLVLAGVVAILSFVNAEKAVPNVLALSVLALSLGALVSVLSKFKVKTGDALKGVLALTAMVVPLVAFGLALHLLPDVSGAKNNIIALVAIMTAMILLLVPLTLIGKLAGFNALTGVLALTAMIVPLVAFGLALHLLPDVSGAQKNIMSLVTVMTAMTLLLVPLSIIGALAGFGSLVGVLALTAMVVPLVAFGLALHLLPDVSGVEKNIMSLVTVMTAMTLLLVPLTIIGAFAGFAMAGISALAAFAAFILAFGVVAAAVGALMDKCEDLQTFLDKGIPVLEQLASGLGSVIGSFITGFAGEVMTILPQLGLCLSAFMVGVQPFITLAGDIDASVIEGAGYLTAAILVLAGAGFITGIMNILSLGQSSFSNLGLQLLIFGACAKRFYDTISGVDASAVEAATNTADMILALTASNLISTITEKFGGSVDFSTMGANLKTFGEAVVGFSETITGRIDVAAVEAATNAGMLLVELNKSLPHSGGWIQDLIGEQDFEKFATACKAFGEAIISINETLSQEGFVIQSEKIEQLVAAGTAFNELNTALPRTGGIAQDLAGEQDLAGFGQACVAFASCMMLISQAVSGEEFVIQSEKIQQLVDAGTAFNELNTALPRTGGIAQDLAGEQDLSAFGKACAAFADCMITINTAVSQEGFAVNLEAIENLKQAGVKMDELQDVLPKTGGWWQEVSGEQDIGDFGKKITTFAEAIVDFSTSSTDLDTTGIDTCISTAYRIKTLMESLIGIDYSGVEAFTGVGTGGIGADGPVYDVAAAISKFSEKVADINTEAVSVAVSSAVSLRNLIAGLVGLDNSGIENFKPGTIGDQMKSFADKVSTVDTEVVSSSISSANRLKTFIAGLVDLDTSGISNFEVSSIGTSLGDYAASVSKFNAIAVSGSITSANQLKNFIAGLADLDTSGVSSFVSALEKLATVDIDNVIKAFSGATDRLSSVGENLINGLINGMKNETASLVIAAEKLVTNAADAIRDKHDVFNKAGTHLVTGFKNGISEESSKAANEAKVMAGDAADSIRDKYDAFYNAGSYLVTGFKNGISDNSYKAAAKAKAMAEAAVEAAREELDINSPSKVFKEIGSGIPEGFAMGITMLGSTVNRSVTDMASGAIKSTRSAMATILEVLDSDIDAQPTIRPVIDLSDAKTGAAAINDMFNGARTVGVRSSLNAVNSMMSNKPQNGNAEVVSAINKLHKDLDKVGNTSYNINGIAVEEGSDVSEAIKVIVRAAKVERRI